MYPNIVYVGPKCQSLPLLLHIFSLQRFGNLSLQHFLLSSKGRRVFFSERVVHHKYLFLKSTGLFFFLNSFESDSLPKKKIKIYLPITH